MSFQVCSKTLSNKPLMPSFVESLTMAQEPLRSIVRQIHSGQLSVADYVGTFWQRCQQLNPQLRALSYGPLKQALAQARVMDADCRLRQGALAGLPIAIKDVIAVAGWPTDFGAHPMFRRWPRADAACVTALKAAGAIIWAKATTAEFAYAQPPATTHPEYPAHTPGGSSSGSAAGVAAGLFPVALSTQTGGSIIRPAAFCGVYGFKPSFGAIDRSGLQAFAPSFDTIGWHARHLDDIALLYEVLVEKQSQTSLDVVAEKPSSFNQLRVGFCPTPFWSQACVATRDLLAQWANRWGAQPITLPIDLAQISKDHRLLMAAEMAHSLRKEYRQGARYLSPVLRVLIKEGQRIPLQEAHRARERLRLNQALFAQSFQKVDVLLAPAAPGTAPRGLQSTGRSVFNGFWSALGAPCLAIPMGRGAQGLPLGLQLVGAPGADRALLTAARQLTGYF